MCEAKTSKKGDEAVGGLEGSWNDLRTVGRVVPRGDKEFFEVSRRINDTNDPGAIPHRRLFLGSLDADDMLVNFLGREPSNEAFLAKLGISGAE